MVERFHSTLLEHLGLLNEQFPNEELKTKVLYAVLAYNHTVHSAIRKRPIEVISGHFDPDDPFDIDCKKNLMNNYVQNHKHLTQLMYQELNKHLLARKENTALKHKKKQRQSKLKRWTTTLSQRSTTSKQIIK